MEYASRPWIKNYPKTLKEFIDQGPYSTENYIEIVNDVTEKFSSNPAFSMVLPDGKYKSLSFEQIDDYSNKLASYLKNTLKLSKGDVVGIQLANCPHYPIITFAAWKIGAIVTNINPLYTLRESEHQLQDSATKVLFLLEQALGNFEKIIELNAQLAHIQLVTVSLKDFFIPTNSSIESIDFHDRKPHQPESFIEILSRHDALNKNEYINHEVAVYQYTGGTTGKSKGAIITHKNILSFVQNCNEYVKSYGFGFNEQDTVLTAIPMYHVIAFCGNFLLFYSEGTHNVLVPSPKPIDNLRPAFSSFKISWITGVETLFSALLNTTWFKDEAKYMRCCISGGAALRPITLEAWKNTISPIYEAFGMTEIASVATMHPLISELKKSSVGIPLPFYEIKIVNDKNQEVPIGHEGELCVKGPQLMQSYLNTPENPFIEGWFHTGDIAKMDQDGYIYILDRKKDMVIVSGFNVYPNEIEAVLGNHPHIQDVAVIGIPDDKTGESLLAYIVPSNDSLTIENVISFCQEHLTAYKVPKKFELRLDLPKTTVGKITRNQLKQAVANNS